MGAYLTDTLQLYAKGGDDGPETNRATRISNAWEMAKLVRNSLARRRHVICVRVSLLLPIYIINREDRQGTIIHSLHHYLCNSSSAMPT